MSEQTPPIPFEDHMKDSIELLKGGKEQFYSNLIEAGLDDETINQMWNDLIEKAKEWGLDINY